MRKPATIFQVEMVAYEKLRRHHRDDYQSFKLVPAWRILFKNLDEAEKALPELIERFKNEHYLPLYWCKIVELPIATVLRDCSQNYSERLYDQNGKKVDERLFPTEDFMDYRHSTYIGRKPEEIRFQPGDVVEYRGGLCVVNGFMRPFKDGAEPYGDSSDDGYNVWIVDELADEIHRNDEGYVELDHAHPAAVDLLPPRFDIPKKVKQRIDNIKQFFSYDKKVQR